MSAPLPDALPYGVRDLKLTLYTDASGTVLASTSLDLPYMQTLSFSVAEEFQELRGDDRVVTTRGKGSSVEWSLEAGGISLPAWAILEGAVIIEEGLTPNRRRIMRKFSSGARPFFRIQGQIISDSQGDLHVYIYRCRTTDSVEGDFADGEFFVTSAGGVGLPLLIAGFDLLYDIIQNESVTAVTTTPVANPLAPPTNLAPGVLTAITAVLNWDDTLGAISYQVYEKVGVGAYAAVVTGRGGTPTPSNTTITTLTTATSYTYKVRAVGAGGVLSDYSNEVSLTTP